MRGLSILACGAIILSLTACPKKNADDPNDGGGDGAATAQVDAGPETTNEAAVTRYPDEAPIDHTAATVKVAKTNVLKAVPKGDVIATLKKGDDVAQVSEHNGYYRVVFPDPKDPTKKLGGWVVKFAFDDPPVAVKAPLPKCTGEGTTLVSDKSKPIVPRCTIFCTEDTDCPSGKCDSALILDSKGNPAVVNGDTHFMSVCSAGKAAAPKDAGAAKPVAVARAVPKCTGENALYAMDPFSGPILCAPSCNADKDCPGKKCVEAAMMMDTGEPALSHNGTPIGTQVCR